MKVSRNTIYKCIDRALKIGVAEAMGDAPHRPRSGSITESAKEWVRALAQSPPAALGYSFGQWSRQTLANHVRAHAVLMGHPTLRRASKATIQRILTKPGNPDLLTREQQRDERLKRRRNRAKQLLLDI